MTRRDAMCSFLGVLAAPFVVPAARRIDLAPFCGGEHSKFDLRLPFTLGDSLFATDAKVCLRVDSHPLDLHHHDGPIPPFASLNWDFSGGRWRDLPDVRPMLASESECPSCRGTGLEGGTKKIPCPAKCQDRFGCDVCGDDGAIVPPGVGKCHTCCGRGDGVFPSVVRVGDQYFEESLFRRITRLGNVEYRNATFSENGRGSLLQFQFDGGTGLLCGLWTEAAERRLTT